MFMLMSILLLVSSPSSPLPVVLLLLLSFGFGFGFVLKIGLGSGSVGSLIACGSNMHGCGSGAVSDSACFEKRKMRLEPDWPVVFFNMDLRFDVGGVSSLSLLMLLLLLL